MKMIPEYCLFGETLCFTTTLPRGTVPYNVSTQTKLDTNNKTLLVLVLERSGCNKGTHTTAAAVGASRLNGYPKSLVSGLISSAVNVVVARQ